MSRFDKMVKNCALRRTHLRPFVARRLLESAGWDFGRVERHVRERRLTESPAFDVLLAGGYCSISRDDEDVEAGWCEWYDEEAGAHVSWVDVRGRARVEGGVVTYSAWRGGRMSSLVRTLPGCVGAPVGEESRTGRARAARGGAGGSTAGRRRRRAEQLGEGGGDDGGDDSDDGLDELVGALGP